LKLIKWYAINIKEDTMKKIFALLIAIVLIGGFAELAMADDGTVTVTRTRLHDDVDVIKFAFIANSTGVVPATSTSVETCPARAGDRTCYPAGSGRIGYIYKMTTDPGSTAPTDDYDITLTDDTTGADLLGGEGADRDTANTEEAVPKIGNAFGGNIAFTSFTLNVSGNSANASTGDVYVYIVY
jgi:hypothetical protein